MKLHLRSSSSHMACIAVALALATGCSLMVAAAPVDQPGLRQFQYGQPQQQQQQQQRPLSSVRPIQQQQQQPRQQQPVLANTGPKRVATGPGLNSNNQVRATAPAAPARQQQHQQQIPQQQQQPQAFAASSGVPTYAKQPQGLQPPANVRSVASPPIRQAQQQSRQLPQRQPQQPARRVGSATAAAAASAFATTGPDAVDVHQALPLPHDFNDIDNSGLPGPNDLEMDDDDDDNDNDDYELALNDETRPGQPPAPAPVPMAPSTPASNPVDQLLMHFAHSPGGLRIHNDVRKMSIGNKKSVNINTNQHIVAPHIINSRLDQLNANAHTKQESGKRKATDEQKELKRKLIELAEKATLPEIAPDGTMLRFNPHTEQYEPVEVDPNMELYRRKLQDAIRSLSAKRLPTEKLKELLEDLDQLDEIAPEAADADTPAEEQEPAAGPGDQDEVQPAGQDEEGPVDEPEGALDEEEAPAPVQEEEEDQQQEELQMNPDYLKNFQSSLPPEEPYEDEPEADQYGEFPEAEEDEPEGEPAAENTCPTGCVPGPEEKSDLDQVKELLDDRLNRISDLLYFRPEFLNQLLQINDAAELTPLESEFKRMILCNSDEQFCNQDLSGGPSPDGAELAGGPDEVVEDNIEEEAGADQYGGLLPPATPLAPPQPPQSPSNSAHYSKKSTNVAYLYNHSQEGHLPSVSRERIVEGKPRARAVANSRVYSPNNPPVVRQAQTAHSSSQGPSRQQQQQQPLQQQRQLQQRQHPAVRASGPTTDGNRGRSTTTTTTSPASYGYDHPSSASGRAPSSQQQQRYQNEPVRRVTNSPSQVAAGGASQQQRLAPRVTSTGPQQQQHQQSKRQPSVIGNGQGSQLQTGNRMFRPTVASEPTAHQRPAQQQRAPAQVYDQSRQQVYNSPIQQQTNTNGPKRISNPFPSDMSVNDLGKNQGATSTRYRPQQQQQQQPAQIKPSANPTYANGQTPPMQQHQQPQQQYQQQRPALGRF